ncbi:solute carrier family 22 member 8 [Dermacentor silvarum]|uniref:solute carrier family 22 member 8 n=1 Tax=Dermacentor silvarum TaxID=543639 RepID=UPI002101A7ED|nr:solute carrier family 22 member 8 [Dermacentor silvarum]
MPEHEKVNHVLKGIADDAFNLLVYENFTSIVNIRRPFPDVPLDGLFPTWIKAVSLSSHYLWTDQTTWLYDEAAVNAFYRLTQNTIVIPTAIIQRPLYYYEGPLALSYGGLGMVVWACFMIGGAVAVPTLGLTADAVGRRPVLIGAVLLLLLSGTGACLSKSLAGFAALRFVSAASSGALDVTSTVLLFESTPSGPRATFMAASVSLATALSPVFVVAVREMSSTWRMMHAMLLVPALLLTFLVCIIEESPHWCLYNNMFDDAERIAMWAARLNLEDPDLVRDRLDRIRKDAESHGDGAAFRSARLLRYITSVHMRSRCFALFGCWFFVYIAYYARDYENLAPWVGDFICTIRSFNSVYSWLCSNTRRRRLNRLAKETAELQAAEWFVVTGNFPAMAAAYSVTRRHSGLRSVVPLLAACSMMSALQSALVAIGGRSLLLMTYCSSVLILNVAYVALVVHTVDAFPTPVRSLGYSGAFMSGRIGAMMGALFREFESMPLPVSMMPTAVTSLGLLAFAASAVLVPPTPKELIADEGSPVVLDTSAVATVSKGSPMSWRVHKRQSPTASLHSERK